MDNGREGMHAGAMPTVSSIAGREGCILEDASRREYRRFRTQRGQRDAYGRMHLGRILAVSNKAGREGCILEDASREQC
jgi:hypothetical protein